MATKEFNITGNGVQYMNDVAQATEQSSNSFKNAKAELRALQNQMLEMDTASEEFKKSAQRAAELKDRITDLSAEINANAGNAFESISNNVSLFGQRLMDLDLAGAGQALTNLALSVSAVDFATLRNELGGLIKGLADLSLSLLKNPWAIAGAAVIAVIAYYDELRDSIDALTFSIEETNSEMLKSEQVMGEMKQAEIQAKQIELLTGAVQDHTRSEEERTEALDKLNYALEQNGLATVDDINNTGALIQAKEMLIQKLKAEALARGKLAYLEELQSKLFKMEQEAAAGQDWSIGGMFKTAAMSSLQMGGAEFMRQKAELDNLKKQIETVSQSIADDQLALDKLQIKGFEYKENKKTEIQKKNNNDRKNDNKKNNKEEEKDNKENIENRLKYEKEANNARLDEIERIQEEIYQASLSQEQREIRAIEDKYFEEIELAKQFGLDATNLELEQQRLIQEIKDKYAKENLQQDAENKKIQQEQQKEFNNAMLEAEQKLYEAKWSVANAGLDVLSTLAGKNKKIADALFLVQKGLSIAQIVVDTQKEIAGYYANPTWSLMPDGGLAIKTANATAAKLRAVASIATIVGASVGKFMNGGGGSNVGGNVGGGGNMGGTNAPSPLSLSFLANQPNQQPPFQAYVISGQVSNSIEAQQLINNQSKL